MIKAVIFDLGGVYFKDGTRLAIEKISREFQITQEKVKSVLSVNSELGSKYRRGEITENKFWSNAIKSWGIKAQIKDLAKIWLEFYVPIDGTVEIIKELKQKGIKLFFLSDNLKERVEYLQQKYNFLENFDDGIFSHLLHKTKADGPEIFTAMLKKIDAEPSDIIYVDDKDGYVVKATELGLKGIYFQNPSQLKDDLMVLGLPF